MHYIKFLIQAQKQLKHDINKDIWLTLVLLVLVNPVTTVATKKKK